MEAEKLAFVLQARLRTIFSYGQDDETKEALVALVAIDETLAVK